MKGHDSADDAVASVELQPRRARTMRHFSATLRRLMRAAGETQSSLAAAVPKVSQQALSGYLASCRMPSADAVLALARYFRCSTDHLLGRRPPRGCR